MRFHHSMCFKETPKTVDGLILLIEKCMETLDDFKDEHLENHYLLTSNYLMAHYKGWDQRRVYEIMPKREQIFKDLMSERYAEFENLEKELKVGLITTHQFGRNLRRIQPNLTDGERWPHLVLKDFEDDDCRHEPGDHALAPDDDDYYIDACGNVYSSKEMVGAGQHIRPAPIQPIGFIHLIMGILIPVPKKFSDQLNWNDPIPACVIHKCKP